MSITITRDRTVQNTLQHTVVAGYICSHCRNPVIITIHIKARSEGSIKDLETKPEVLKQKAVSSMNEMLNIIQTYLQNPSWKTYPKNTKEMACTGWNTPCPACGELETWQDEKLIRKQHVVNTVSFFPDMDQAYEWARALLESRKKKSDEIFASAEARDAVLRLDKEAIAEQNALRVAHETGKTAQLLEELQDRKKQLSAEMETLSAHAPERKEMQKALDNCNDKIREANRKYLIENEAMEVKIAEIDLKREDYRLLQVRYGQGAFLFKTSDVIALKLQKEDEKNTKAQTIDLQPLVKVGILRVSPHEKNKEQLEQVLDASILKVTD